MQIFREVSRHVANKPKGEYRLSRAQEGAYIECNRNGNRLELLGSGKPERLHSRQAFLTIWDEFCKYPVAQFPDAWAAIHSGLEKIPGSRILCVGTRADDPEHKFESLLHGEADYSQLHAYKPKKDIPKGEPDTEQFTLKALRAANPSLDHFPDMKRRLQKKARKAKGNPILLQEFRSLNLNMCEAETPQNRLFTAAAWRSMVRPSKPGKRYVLGVDLGGGGINGSFSALCAYQWADDGRVDAIAALPKEPPLRQREKHDSVGSLYRTLVDRGELYLLGNESVDYEALLRIALDRWGQPEAVIGDFYRSDIWVPAMRRCNVKCGYTTRRVGAISQGQDILDSELAAEDGRLHPVDNLLLAKAISNAKTEQDKTGNFYIVKKRGRAFIDPAAAMVLAVGEGYRGWRKLQSRNRKPPRLVAMKDRERYGKAA